MTRVSLCACGCGTSLAGLRSGAKWASGACAKRWLRANPGKSLSAARIPDVGPTRPGGITVSYRKAVEGVATALLGDYGFDAAARAQNAVFDALPARQRKRLEAMR